MSDTKLTKEQEIHYAEYVRRTMIEYDKGYWMGTHGNWRTMANRPWMTRKQWLEKQNASR